MEINLCKTHTGLLARQKVHQSQNNVHCSLIVLRCNVVNYQLQVLTVSGVDVRCLSLVLLIL